MSSADDARQVAHDNLRMMVEGIVADSVTTQAVTKQSTEIVQTKITGLLPLIADQLADLIIDPFDLHITAPATADPIVKIVFRSRTDLERFAANDRAKVDEVSQLHRGYIEYSALYNRPGRRMQLAHHCFAHCVDRTGGAE